MRLLQICVLCLLGFHLLGQDYFLKKISFDEDSNTGRRMFFHQDRLFVLAGHFCGELECGSIAELSILGDTLWRTRMPEMDIARSTITIYSDTITVTGNNPPFHTKFRMAHFNLEGQKLGETIEIEHATEKFEAMFQLNTELFGDRILLSGIGTRADTMYGLVYVVDKVGNLDTLLALEKMEESSVIWDTYVNAGGELLTFHQLTLSNSSEELRKINKFDQDFRIIWSYTSEISDEFSSGGIGTELDDGRVLLTVYTPNEASSNRSIRAINPDGTIDWQYNPSFVLQGVETTGNIKQLGNGDIIGMGRFTETWLEPKIERVPFLYRMSTEGEIIWKRIFYDLDPIDGESRNGGIRDVVELENGDLFGIGEMRYDNQNEVIVFRVDADGCLDAADCGLIQVITSSEEVVLSEDVHLYPNPASEVLNIEVESIDGSLECMVIDAMGKKIFGPIELKNRRRIDTRDYTTGAYTLILLKDGVVVGSKRFVVRK